MAPQNKRNALKKEVENLKKKQHIEDDDSDLQEEDEEEDDEIDIEGELEAEDDDEEEDDDGEEEEGDDDDEDDEDDDDEDAPKKKLPPSTERITRPGDEDLDDEEEEGTGKAKEQMMMHSKGGQPDQAILNMKINDILHVLAKFKENNKEERSRQSYLEELTDYLMQYYNYNRDLVQLFMTMFNPNELVAFFEANEAQRPVTIRTNTLKTRRKELAQILIQRGVNLDSLADWTKVGLKIYETKVPVGATPEYLAGHYMLQSASSFLPVIALAPQTDEKILDMAAAPGGKTTYIAQLMKNTGVLFANDVKADRNKALIFNVQRMGINNCIVTNFDGRKLPKVINNCDRVLLDAPCTGLGIIARDASVKATKQLIDVLKHAHLQRELLLSAVDCCKKGGYIVYSTCSVSVQENEAVVDFALKNRFVKLVEMGIDVGEEGYTKYQDKRFDPSLKRTRRILPHVHNMDGFYVAKFKKLENGPRSKKEETENVNLGVSKGGEVEFEEQETLAELKNKHVKIRQGAQGTVEVTANGEDFDWDEDGQQKFQALSEKKLELSKTILTKKQDKIKESKKNLKDKQITKQEQNQKKNEKAAKTAITEESEKKVSKKDKKIADKAEEKQEKNDKASDEEQAEENGVEAEDEAANGSEETAAAPRVKKDFKRPQKGNQNHKRKAFSGMNKPGFKQNQQHKSKQSKFDQFKKKPKRN